MHLASSMSNRVLTRFFGLAGSFSSSIAITLIGQARSQAWQAVHVSMSTSRNPRYLEGRVYCTSGPSCLAAASGPAYWMVIGRRNMYDRVTLIPSHALFTVSLRFPTYWVTGILSPFLYQLLKSTRSPVTWMFLKALISKALRG